MMSENNKGGFYLEGEIVGWGFAKSTPWNTVSLISSVTKRVESPLSPSLLAGGKEGQYVIGMSLLIIGPIDNSSIQTLRMWSGDNGWLGHSTGHKLLWASQENTLTTTS